MSKGWGNGEFRLKANGDQGGRILSQLGGFQVSGKGTKGSKGCEGSKENGESKGNAPCI
jgi:hypothetical protein